MPKTTYKFAFAIIGLFFSSVTFAGFEQANAAFEAGNYALAQKELKPLLEKGDARDRKSVV